MKRAVRETSDLTSERFGTEIQNAFTGCDEAGPVRTDVSVDSANVDAGLGANVLVTVMASDAGSGLCTAGCGGGGGPSQIATEPSNRDVSFSSGVTPTTATHP